MCCGNRQEPGEQVEIRADLAGGREALRGVCAAASTHPNSQRRVGQQPLHSGPETRRVASRDEKTRFIRREALADARRVEGHGGQLVGLRLDEKFESDSLREASTATSDAR